MPWRIGRELGFGGGSWVTPEKRTLDTVPLTLLGRSTPQPHTSQQILRTTVVYYRLWRDTLVLLYLWIYTFGKKKKPAE